MFCRNSKQLVNHICTMVQLKIGFFKLVLLNEYLLPNLDLGQFSFVKKHLGFCREGLTNHFLVEHKGQNNTIYQYDNLNEPW